MNPSGVAVVVTGTTWMGGGIGSIESALERIFREASDEITLTAYSITAGADLLLDWIQAALARGVRIRIVIDSPEDQSSDVMAWLRNLRRGYPNLHLFGFVGGSNASLHAKAIVADARLAIVGSSNLSRRGLLINHEIAVFIEGAPAALVSTVLERLFSNRMLVIIPD